MITLAKFEKLCKSDPWLKTALLRLKQVDDKRPFEKRIRESVAFIAFRPFAQAKPNWTGKIAWHGFFHNSGAAGSDGILYTSYPLIVFRQGDSAEYQTIELLTSGSPTWDCSIREAMQWHIDDAKRRNEAITFVAIVKPLQAYVRPHHMMTEIYEVYKFPADFKFEAWVEVPTIKYDNYALNKQLATGILRQHFQGRLIDEVKLLPKTAMLADAAALVKGFNRREEFVQLYLEAAKNQ